MARSGVIRRDLATLLPLPTRAPRRGPGMKKPRRCASGQSEAAGRISTSRRPSLLPSRLYGRLLSSTGSCSGAEAPSLAGCHRRWGLAPRPEGTNVTFERHISVCLPPSRVKSGAPRAGSAGQFPHPGSAGPCRLHATRFLASGYRLGDITRCNLWSYGDILVFVPVSRPFRRWTAS